jgi:hypothetical protein
MDFADPEPGQVHEGIDRVIPKAENSGAVNGSKKTGNLAGGESLWSITVALADLEDIIERQGVGGRYVYQPEMLAVSAEGKDLAVDGSAGVIALIFQEILKIHHALAINAVMLPSRDKIAKQVEIDPV